MIYESLLLSLAVKGRRQRLGIKKRKMIRNEEKTEMKSSYSSEEIREWRVSSNVRASSR